MLLYTIYDTKAEECGPVLEAKNDAVAIRHYKNALDQAKAGTQDEYWLYCIGEINVLDMVITGKKPRKIEVNKGVAVEE
jgi:hypothetical protein|nr:MAG: nonstructural protein [Microviridae sp.]